MKFGPFVDCREATRLVSQSLDTPLAWHQRLAMRLHLLYCTWCRRYASQIRFLRQAAKTLAEPPDQAPPHSLSSEARTQIQARLREELKKDSPPPPSSL